MLLDLISITRTKKVKFSTNEYKAIRILAEQQLAVMKKEENPDEQLKFVMNTLESIHDKVKHK